jgi:hypothetical protein
VFTRPPSPQDRGFTNYMANWFRTVAAAGFTPGIYCSPLDTGHLG